MVMVWLLLFDWRKLALNYSKLDIEVFGPVVEP